MVQKEMFQQYLSDAKIKHGPEDQIEKLLLLWLKDRVENHGEFSQWVEMAEDGVNVKNKYSGRHLDPLDAVR